MTKLSATAAILPVKPTVQVIERIFSLLDILANREDAMSLKEISAKSGIGIPELLEKVLLEAEMLDVKANPNKPARGTVIEARLDKGRGVVATVLVQDGSLEVGDSMVAGVHFARVRAMQDERGKRVKKVGPSTPVQLIGLAGTPQAGDRFVVYEDERKAKDIALRRSELYRDASGVIHLDYLVPLQQPPGSEKRAVILLHTPVEQFLFPLIQHWPTPSASAETMLVRREGDKVLYLNELRHRRNTALTLTVPLDKGTSPSVIAVRAGKARYMETSDIRGVQVLAASRPVAGADLPPATYNH